MQDNLICQLSNPKNREQGISNYLSNPKTDNKSNLPVKYQKHKPRDLKFTCQIPKTENMGSQINLSNIQKQRTRDLKFTCRIQKHKPRDLKLHVEYQKQRTRDLKLPVESKNINQGISNLPAKYPKT